MFYRKNVKNNTNSYNIQFIFFAIILVIATIAISYTSILARDIAETIEPSSPIADQCLPSKVVVSTPLLFIGLEYKATHNAIACGELLSNVKSGISQVENAIKSGDYSPNACEAMVDEWVRLKLIASKLENDMAKISKWEDEYYYAAKTWEFFIARGYSKTVTSAIIGNMMIETSGGTLDLKPTIYNATKDYYGLCQWSLYYKPEVAGMSFEEQLEYLVSDIEEEFKIFGGCYKEGFTYLDFMIMTDPAEAAVAFAAVYERCGYGSYSLRKQAAIEAFNYFKLN